MLKLKNITKTYMSGEEKVEALKGIDIQFRRSEFVSILGQSGCGKTTLLNIIGGLDRYTDGDLIINGKSTKEYKDRDWDYYRNYSVGFVFQSYNLILHQTVLENVELALTISGYSQTEKRKKAIKALQDVGLGDKLYKKPNQLSGGQMQRVAIARAIVNDPSIILADEPTGALDTKTSEQIMELLKEISKNKLIIMVTHNPEIAERYSSRIVNLLDGKVIGDSNPYHGGNERKVETGRRDKRSKSTKTHMSFTTALKLSLNNLMTKKGRTILTSFAGSIGIIGIALILSLSSGVNNYITDLQKETMLSYPISIEAESMDLSSMLASGREEGQEKEVNHEKDAVYSDGSSIKRASTMTTSISKNNLTELKKYLDSSDCEMKQYIGENGIVYSYDTKFDVYNYDSDGKLVNSDGSTFETKSSSNNAMSSMLGSYNDTFTQLMSGTTDDKLISDAVLNEYEVLYGEMPKEYNEAVLVVDENNEISATTLYNLGLLPSSEYKEILEKINNDEEVTIDTQKITYEDLLGKSFKLISVCDYYVKNESTGLFDYVGDSTGKVEELLKEKGIELKITGIIKQKEDSKTATVEGTVAYTKKLTDYLIDYTNKSEVVKAQEENQDVNVVNGMKFKVSSDEEKASDAKEYLSNLSISEKAEFCSNILTQVYGDNPQMAGQMLSMSEEQLAKQLDQYLKNPETEMLVNIYDTYISAGSYDENLKDFGVVSLDTPSSIEIYADTFEDKDAITDCINKYNENANEDDKISYTDYVGLLMSSVTTIVNAISYVLIAFVSISLIVSSIMIAIITYISVLERTKEIGILRAMGTSKRDISKIFNAETFIEGLVAGLLGVGVTCLLNIPINAIILKVAQIEMKSVLPLQYACLLVFISVFLTVIAGLVPSKLAAKKDPAVVLRSE